MYTIYAATHTGCVRQHNEDRYACRLLTEQYGYALVCDGMGGERGGSVASALACDEICRTLDGSYREGLDEKSVYMILETAVTNANNVVYSRARAEGNDLYGMGTTASLAVLLDDTCYLANVGDSRVYLLRDGELMQLTVDHTHVQLLLERGEITEEEAQDHPQRHYLTKAVGVESSLTPYFRQETLQAGDLLLLCSDGLHGTMERGELAAVMAQAALLQSCDPLIDEALKRGGPDNVTAVLVVHDGGAVHG